MRSRKKSALILFLVAALMPSLTGAVSNASSSSLCAHSAESCAGTPELSAEFQMSVAPKRLPSHQLAPAALKFSTEVSTGGEQPPPLREIRILIDRHITIDAKGLPVCHPSRVYGTGLSLEKVCRAAIIGRGRAHFEIALPGGNSISAPSRLTAYNTAMEGGHPSLLMAGELEKPTPVSFDIEVSLKRTDKGSFGLEAVLVIPRIDGGSGSLVNLRFDLQRAFARSGSQAHYVSASCRGRRLLSKAALLFENQNSPITSARTVKSVSPCTGEG